MTMCRQLSDEKLATIIWDYMRLEHPIEPADCIIGLGNADLRTADWCAHLYHQGSAPRIIFTGNSGRITKDIFTDSEAELFSQRAISLGVPESAILKESQATNTGENIVFTHQLLQSQKLPTGSIILVTKPYMTRRAYATFMKQWPTSPKPRVMCSALDVDFKSYCNDAHQFSQVVAIMVGDLRRIRDYPKLGFQIEQDIPDVVWEAGEELVRRGYFG